MGERKVLNKYFPPDFDPAKLPKGKRPDHNMMKVRMMLPMSIRCGTCGTFLMKGTKFNMRKEDVDGEKYLGIQVLRFYMRCTACSAEITMKTDWKNADYTMERGASRNYEPWREKDRAVAEAVREREEEERGNAMKALENRTLDSKREMDILTALDEMRSLNARHAQVDPEAALAALKRSAEEQIDDLEAEDEALVREMVLQQSRQVKRLQEDEDAARPPVAGPMDRGQDGAGPSNAANPSRGVGPSTGRAPDLLVSGAPAAAKPPAASSAPAAAQAPPPRARPPLLVVKKRKPEGGGVAPAAPPAKVGRAEGNKPLVVKGGAGGGDDRGSSSGSEGGGLAGLLGGYASSKDSD